MFWKYNQHISFSPLSWTKSPKQSNNWRKCAHTHNDLRETESMQGKEKEVYINIYTYSYTHIHYTYSQFSLFMVVIF